MLGMPLYSFVQGSYKFSSSPPSKYSMAQWLLGSELPKERYRNLLSIWAEVNSKLLHCLQSQSHEPHQLAGGEGRARETGVLAGKGSG